MKKYLLLLLSFVVILNSCKKINGFSVLSGSYQPLSAGSSWSYKIDYGSTGFTPDTTTTVMTSQGSVFNNKQYQLAIKYSASSPSSIDSSYFYANDHVYSIYQTIGTYSYEEVYLKDNLPVGGTWNESTSTFTLNGKIVEKGITKVVAGKTYTNVIHTNAIETINSPSVSGNTSTDYYIAPGVGLIDIEITDLTSNIKLVETLIGSNIK